MTVAKNAVTSGNLPRVMTAIRKALGLSQSELAELSGISRQMLSYYETGQSVPTPHSLDSWILGVKLAINKLKPETPTN